MRQKKPPGIDLDHAEGVATYMNDNLSGLSITVFESHPLYRQRRRCRP